MFVESAGRTIRKKKGLRMQTPPFVLTQSLTLDGTIDSAFGCPDCWLNRSNIKMYFTVNFQLLAILGRTKL